MNNRSSAKLRMLWVLVSCAGAARVEAQAAAQPKVMATKPFTLSELSGGTSPDQAKVKLPNGRSLAPEEYVRQLNGFEKQLNRVGSCGDLDEVRARAAESDVGLRGEAFAAARFMRCPDAGVFLHAAFNTEADPRARRRIIEALRLHAPAPLLVPALLHDLHSGETHERLAAAEAELLARWYPALAADDQQRVRLGAATLPARVLTPEFRAALSLSDAAATVAPATYVSSE